MACSAAYSLKYPWQSPCAATGPRSAASTLPLSAPLVQHLLGERGPPAKLSHRHSRGLAARPELRVARGVDGAHQLVLGLHVSQIVRYVR